MSADSATSETGKKSGWLDLIERVGNRLPHPMTLFIVGTLIVLVLSQIADVCNWSAEKTVMKTEASGTKVQTVETVTATGLLAGDGAFWAIKNMVKNFTEFAPLGVVHSNALCPTAPHLQQTPW